MEQASHQLLSTASSPSQNAFLEAPSTSAFPITNLAPQSGRYIANFTQASDGGNFCTSLDILLQTQQDKETVEKEVLAATNSPLWAWDKVIVNYLPAQVTTSQVTEIFGAKGDIVKAEVVIDRITGVSHGYAFVQYVDGSSASRAVTELNGLEMENKILKVSYALPRMAELQKAKVIISRLPLHWDCFSMLNHFRTFGVVKSCRIIWDGVKGVSRGYGFVQYLVKEKATSALNQTNGIFKPLGSATALSVQIACNAASRRAPRVAVFVGNLHPGQSEAVLRTLFSQHWSLHSVKVVRSGTSSYSGWGFINFFRLADALEAIDNFHGFSTGESSQQLFMELKSQQ